MANTSVSGPRATASDFSVGRVFDRTTSIYTRNFLMFSLVPMVAFLPTLLLPVGAGGMPQDRSWIFMLLAVLLAVVLSLLSQAILVYASFQDMRGKPVDIGESINVALVRFLPILGLAILAGFCTMIGFILLVVPGFILLTMWFVAVPVCIVERAGPWDSMMRSGQLTKGHRWKIFGIIFLLYLISGVVGYILTSVIGSIAGSMVSLIIQIIWNGIWGAFFAVFVVVAYYELRSSKEGVDIEQIASVFD
jgi:hypothetical protein